MSLPEPTLFDPNDEETEFSNLDKLQAVHPELHETPEENQETSTSSQASSVIETNNRNQNQIDPGDIVLIQNLGPNNPELAPYGTGLPDGSSPEVLTDDHREMTNQVEAQGVKLEPNGQDVHPTAVVSKQPLKDGVEASDCLSQAAVNNQDLAEQAKRVLQLESTSNEHNYDQQTGPSALMSIKENRNGQLQADIRTRSGRVSPAPLKLHTKPTNTQQEDTIATSPRLCKHVITAPRQAEGTLPALQHSPTKDGTASSPQTEKLPSFRQLSELAAVATQQDPLVYHQHRQSFGSASAQSPGIPYLYAQGSAHTSPSTQYVHSARSPSSAIHEHHYNSPTNIPPQSYYGDRRSSVVTDTATPFPPASLPSASSSGDSAGHTSSSTDGYSTAHTTPTDSASGVENNQRPILPPPHGIPPNPVMIQNGYRCDHPGCTAVPFQTQYLLSSHKNVHSSNRPHYCPVKSCPRGEGGRGFKRKNEMIRHGLVHNSPGYICPFCPDREHRYPRPDNLQRHVRVHHVDKDRDDPALRDVLSQRTEGTNSKARRRRTNTNGSTTS